MEKLLISKGFKPRRGLVKKCLFCKDKFYTYPSRINHIYCSVKCKDLGQRKNKNLKCFICNKEYYRPISQVKWRGSSTCSVKCRGEMQTIKFSGENSRVWKGGVSDPMRRIRSSKKFREWRELVFKRDNYECQDCGNKNVDLHPHHIKPFILFPELRFELSNGITLCPICHKKEDNLNRKRYNFKQFYKKILNK